MSRRNKIGAMLGIAGLAAAALLIPAAVSATSVSPSNTGPGFTPHLTPSHVAVKCLPGHQFGVSVAAVHISIHVNGNIKLAGAKEVDVYGLPGKRYVLKSPHYLAWIPKGTRMPCTRSSNQGRWVPVPATKKTRSSETRLYFTHCASPHC